MNVRVRPGETRIVVSSASGRDLGLFLIFLALVGTAPALYMYDAIFLRQFVAVRDWAPAINASIILIVFGLLLMFNTHKVILVRDHLLLVRDGFWRRALRFQWSESCCIKMRSIEQEIRHRVFEVWQIKLVSQGYEYLVDARPNQQLLSRRLAEALAKSLHCDLVEVDQGRELVIASGDLDLPFCDRVRKYPTVIGTSVSIPPNASALIQYGTQPNGHRFFRWGVTASWLLLEILLLTLVALLLSVLPWHDQSIFYLAVAHNNYSYYYGVLLLLFLSMVVLPGFQAELVLNDAVSYRAMIWRVPIDSNTIPLEQVEEIRQYDGIRGPVVQIISDRRIISFRVSDRDLARWLAYEVGRIVARCPGLEATTGGGVGAVRP